MMNPSTRYTSASAHADLFANASDSPLQSFLRAARKFATVSELMRMVGAGVILVALSVFLLQGWHEGNDVRRYLLLLAQTGLLGAAGLAMSHGLREVRGARVFFGLALVSVPANFAILGALVYSITQWDGGLTTYPAFASWQTAGMASTALTTAVALTLLAPLTLFCFAVFARRSSRSLTLHFLCLNLLLLLPVRSSFFAGALVLAGALYALRAAGSLGAADATLRAAGGRFALGVLCIPLGIVAVRSIYLYDVEPLVVAMLATAVWFGLRQASLIADRDSRIPILLDAVSLPVAALAAVAFAAGLPSALGAEYVAPLAATAFAAFGTDVMQRSLTARLRRGSALLVCSGLACGFVASVLVSPTAVPTILAILAGGLLGCIGIWTGSRAAGASGAVILVAALTCGFGSLVELVVTSSWIALAAAGASIIVLGSMLERHGAYWRHRTVRWLRSRYDGARELHPSAIDA